MRSLSLLDLAFLRAASAQFAAIPNDDFEGYVDGEVLNGLDGGEDGNHLFVIEWTSVYADRNLFLGIQALDEMDDYNDADPLQGLDGGFGFSAAYQDHLVYVGLKDYDDMESYADTSALNGLNGGTGWGTAYVNHNF
jgi:hypothetical protein